MARSPVILLLAAALVAYTTDLAAAQSSAGVPECATKLAPCFSYLNATTTPPSTCCGPLKDAVTHDQKCLCGIYNNPDLIKTFNINVTQALNLISLCHVESVKDPQKFCKALAPSSSPTPPSSGSTAKPSGSASATTSSPPNNAGAKFTAIGLVSFLLIVGVYAVFS